MKYLYSCCLQFHFLRVCSPFLSPYCCTTYLLYCPQPFSVCFAQQKLSSFSSIDCHLLPVLHWLLYFYCSEFAQGEMQDLLNMNCCNKQSAKHLKQLIRSTLVWGGSARLGFFFFPKVSQSIAHLIWMIVSIALLVNLCLKTFGLLYVQGCCFVLTVGAPRLYWCSLLRLPSTSHLE